MNYQDLVAPNNPKSWQNTVPRSASKRFSMNFQDTLGYDCECRTSCFFKCETGALIYRQILCVQ